MSVLTTEAKSTYLSFYLAEKIFALEVDHVREVLDVVDMTRIPNMPEYLRGVINLRGSVVPVADMRLKLGMEPAGLTVDTCIIVAEMTFSGQTAEVGILVDSVQEVCEIRTEDIEPPPNMGMDLNSKYLKGIGKYRESFIIIMDLERVFLNGEIPMMQAGPEVEMPSEGIALEL